MDHHEQSSNQFEQIEDGSTQTPAAPAFGYSATPVLATRSLRAPVPVPPVLPPQASDNRAELLSSLQQKLQLFWEGQMKQAEQITSFKNPCVPLARIRKIMKADPDVNMIAAETPVMFAKAVEMFIIDMTLRSWAHTEEERRRILRPKDIAKAVGETDIFDFLTDVVPKHLSKPTLARIPEVGSSSMTYQYEQQFAPQAEQNEQQQQQQQQESSVPQAPQPEKMQLDGDEEF